MDEKLAARLLFSCRGKPTGHLGLSHWHNGWWERGAEERKNMSRIDVKLPESVQDALKYGANCYGEIRVNVRESGTGFSYGYTRCGAEWFVEQNGGRTVVGRALDLIGELGCCEMDIPSDSIISLTEAQ